MRELPAADSAGSKLCHDDQSSASASACIRLSKLLSLFLCWCLPFRLGRPYHAALLHIIILVHLHRTSIANEFPRHVLVELLHTMLCELCLCQPRDETSVAAPPLAHTANTENESALIVLFVLLCTTSCARHLCQEPREISASSAAVVAATPVPSALAVALQTHRRR